MKRKRFIKLLMEQGMERNAAHRLAEMAQRHRIPYFKALGDFTTLLACWEYNRTLDCIEQAIFPDRNAWLEVLAGE